MSKLGAKSLNIHQGHRVKGREAWYWTKYSIFKVYDIYHYIIKNYAKEQILTQRYVIDDSNDITNENNYRALRHSIY